MERITETAGSYEFLLAIYGLAAAISIAGIVFLLTRISLKLVNYFSGKNRLIKPTLDKHFFAVHGFSLVLSAAIGLQGFFIISKLTGLPPEIKMVPDQATVLTAGETVEFTFRSPIDMRMVITNTKPDLAGRWEKDTYHPKLPFGRKIRFVPDESYPPDTEIMIYLSNITRPFAHEWGGEHLFRIKTAKPAAVTGIKPENTGLITPDATLTMTVNGDTLSAHWELVSTPSARFNLKQLSPTLYRISFPDRLTQGAGYRLTVFRTPVVRNLKTMAVSPAGEKEPAYVYVFETVKPPLVADFAPERKNAPLDTKIIIGFDREMEKTTADGLLKITPEIPGKAIWSPDAKNLIYTPEILLSKKTRYTVELKQGLKTAEGGILDEPQTYDFSTVGPPEVIMTSPSDKAGEVPVDSAITISFDQAVPETAANQAIDVIPETGFSVSWNNQTVTLKPRNNFAYATAYTVNIDAGIPNGLGMVSEKPVSFSFTTAALEHKLPVAHFPQEENFTCNLAAARMLLSYRGIRKTEKELKTEAGNGGVRGSGDPNRGYVASYGTYWEAVRQLTSKYRPSRLLSNLPLETLLQEVKNNTPVMVWGQNGWSDPHEISWSTPEGKRIYAVNGMHSYVITGYTGTSENPTLIHVNDPWRGQYKMETARFKKLYAYFGMALAVD